MSESSASLIYQSINRINQSSASHCDSLKASRSTDSRSPISLQPRPHGDGVREKRKERERERRVEVCVIVTRGAETKQFKPPARLPTCPPACLGTLSARLARLVYQQACRFTCACLPACLPDYLLVCLSACLLACPPCPTSCLLASIDALPLHLQY